MSNAYLIKKPDLILEVWTGTITKDEFLEHERRHLQDPDFPSAPKAVVDITAASFDSEIKKMEIQQFVDLYQDHHDKVVGARVAIVSGKEFDRASLYAQLTEPHQINVIVFSTINTACLWLGVNETEVREWLERTRAKLLGG
jgi:hypothetical protein